MKEKFKYKKATIEDLDDTFFWKSLNDIIKSVNLD